MKTFKLNMLEIVDLDAKEYEPINIPLSDGLIINREDDQNRWLIEAYTDRDFLDFFTETKQKYEELILHVKITTELNEKATCLTSIIDINEIGDKMNVLFLGTMVEQRTKKLELRLDKLVSQGYRGKELLEQFKGKLQYQNN